MTTNDLLAARIKTGAESTAAYDADHGRYTGATQVTPYRGAPEPVEAPNIAPPAPAIYQDNVQAASREELLGLTAFPRLPEPLPYLKR